jgi:hypothetical protein
MLQISSEWICLLIVQFTKGGWQHPFRPSNHVDCPTEYGLDFYFEMQSALRVSRIAEVMNVQLLRDPSGMRSTTRFTVGYKPRL